ncbi:hypothetical protein OSTOST_10125 [Ostertagia ostertagi]
MNNVPASATATTTEGRFFISTAMRSSLRCLGENIRRSIVHSNNGQSIGKTVYLTHVKWVTGKALHLEDNDCIIAAASVLFSDQLQDYFSRYGHVRSVNMFFDAETGLHRGFASVTFEHPESATKAMQQRPHVIDGDRIDLEPYIPMLSKKKDVML